MRHVLEFDCDFVPVTNAAHGGYQADGLIWLDHGVIPSAGGGRAHPGYPTIYRTGRPPVCPLGDRPVTGSRSSSGNGVPARPGGGWTSVRSVGLRLGWTGNPYGSPRFDERLWCL